ncbi:alpha/beta fold hydrolase [Amycolatopsis sp. GM8]|uniref:alpha/beta fold hydrolase n=1 Tax=Amycolatopsis sp. GM8 TaxID=2896530 RepID=UPI001F1DAA3D|nr:alpha/beta hydrolase [Amycolatopsis sp. GM8]
MTDNVVVRANGIDICYESLGDPGDPALLLIMGMGTQLNGWEMEFVSLFVDRGFRVVRFDNRDTGRSTWFGDAVPDLPAARAGDVNAAVYSLADMADDAAGLLDALGIERAHVAGASMGGQIAQTLAIRHPGRVLSLASIMSTTGDRTVGRALPEALAAIVARAPDTREETIAAALERGRVLAGGGFPFDAELARVRAERAYDRANNPLGKVRQQAALLTGGDRTAALRELRVPAVVIHGTADPLVTVSGGEATAAAIPGAELVLIEGMGHEFPAGARARIVDAIAVNAARVHA